MDDGLHPIQRGIALHNVLNNLNPCHNQIGCTGNDFLASSSSSPTEMSLSVVRGEIVLAGGTTNSS
jgi:hypothetical protein